EIPLEKWFTNLESVGNVGSASPYVMLEELFYSDKIKKGQKILMMIPESARFSFSYVLLTVV
ncbi:MAG TPA: 3-oxoacyl-[acyl-carrier-protein] synthase III C-terminal domain-containing protein, partial [Alphaproteobacteria bacterium]|nr:3-oxoacyl-[acyl-carrier-protein] synthase III C-terminal domain-containing protein [Alphaproteobacteria bacterium]